MRFDHHMLIPLIQLESFVFVSNVGFNYYKAIRLCDLSTISSKYKTNIKADKLLFELILLMCYPYTNIL